MAFCSNCGAKLSDGVKFCSECGAAVPNSENKSSEQRKQNFAGTVVKCPSCGEEIPSLTAFCPACGHEINSASVSDGLKDFIARIDDCDMRIANSSETPKRGWSTWSKGQRIVWVILNVFLYCIPLLIYFLRPLLLINVAPRLTSNEKQKVAVIDNFTCPNDRGSILEAMLFVRSKVSLLASGKIDRSTAYWIRLWVNKAKQLYKNAEILFAGDKIASDTYREIIDSEKKVQKKLLVRFFGSVLLIIIAILVMSISRGALKQTHNSPSISTNTATNDTKGIYSYEIRDYVGKNAASVGKISGSNLIDEYGSGELNIIFVAEDGLLIDANDEDTRKQYSVIAQNIPVGTSVIVVHKRDSSGKPYSTLVDYQSYDEIVLFVAPIGTSTYAPIYTELLPTLDRHTYHIREYVGRNAASFGNYSGSDRIDEYGAGEMIIKFNMADGSFVDTSDINVLKKYSVVGQDIAANTQLTLEYKTDSNGKEYNTLIQSQNHEVIYLTLEKLDDSVIAKLPEVSISSNTSASSEYEELTIEYTVISGGQAEITGYSGTGNHATIDSKIDGHEVVRIGDHAFENCTTLESVLFWADIEEIGDYAFSGCTALGEISVPNETKSIGKHAFEGCTNLTSAVLWGDPDIGEYAFAGCTALPKISIGYDTTKVGAHAFDGCSLLSEAIIWNDDTVVEKDAFANCPKLTNRPIQK